MGCNIVVIESDSSFAVESIGQEEPFLGQHAATVMECKDLFAQLSSFMIQHCFREANVVAHELAIVAYYNSSSGLWDDSIPDLISLSIVKDLSVI